MTNRLKQWMEEPEDRPPAGDYFEIGSDAGMWYVSRETGEALAVLLRRRWPPRWLRFVDIFGASVCVLTRTGNVICESTGTQRQTERAFRRQRRREEKDGIPPWEDDWW